MDQQISPPYLDNTDTARPMKVKDLPQEMRPREELWKRGAAHVSNEILLAILLRSGTSGKNVTELARELLQRFKGLENLSRVQLAELRGLKIKGLGKIKCTELAAAFEITSRIVAKRLDQAVYTDEPLIRTPESAYHILAPLAENLKQESFWVILLDTRKKMIGRPVTVALGLLDSAPVHPREVFNAAIRCNASSIIIAHNHPSGDPTPSEDDIAITRRLIEVSEIVGIKIVDHLIIGQITARYPGFISMRAQHLLAFD